MNTTHACAACLFAALALQWSAALADERADYYRRAAMRDTELFQTLDRDADAVVTRAEAAGDLTLGPRFDDVDINRDGRMTRAELQDYIRRHYGLEGAMPSSAAAR